MFFKTSLTQSSIQNRNFSKNNIIFVELNIKNYEIHIRATILSDLKIRINDKNV